MLQETIRTAWGLKYHIGDKMELYSRWNRKKIPCEVSEISPSGKYLKVNICDKWYRAENLHQRCRTELYQHSTYLIRVEEIKFSLPKI